MVWVDGIWRIFKYRLPIVIYTGHSFLLPAKFERCVPSNMKIKGSTVSPSQSVALTLIGTLLSLSISAYLCPPPPGRSVHFISKACWLRIAVEATLRGVNEMLRIRLLPHQPPHAFDDVSSPVFNRPLVIVIPSLILKSDQFPLPESLIH